LSELKTVFTTEQIAARVRELGKQISRDYAGREITIIGILTGSFVFLADLIRAIDVPVSCYFVRVVKETGVGNRHNLTEIHFLSDTRFEGRDVLLVGTVVDTGITLDYLVRQMELQAPSSLKSCVFIDKPQKRRVDFTCDYVGFEVADQQLVGYGLDADGRYLNLPHLAEMVP